MEKTTTLKHLYIWKGFSPSHYSLQTRSHLILFVSFFVSEREEVDTGYLSWWQNNPMCSGMRFKISGDRPVHYPQELKENPQEIETSYTALLFFGMNSQLPSRNPNLQ